MTKLLDGKWEPHTYINDMREQLKRMDRAVASYAKQKEEIEKEIQRAERFLTEEDTDVPLVNTAIMPVLKDGNRTATQVEAPPATTSTPAGGPTEAGTFPCSDDLEDQVPRAARNAGPAPIDLPLRQVVPLGVDLPGVEALAFELLGALEWEHIEQPYKGSTLVRAAFAKLLDRYRATPSSDKAKAGWDE